MTNTADLGDQLHVEALGAPAAGRQEYLDTVVPGLYLRVTSKGVKTFSVLARPKGGKPERVTLGKFPIVSGAEARATALQVLKMLTTGISVAHAARVSRGLMTLAELATLMERDGQTRQREPGGMD